jgi:hypothetical protein
MNSTITANLAEGSGRGSLKDHEYFTNKFFSSALDIIDHLTYAMVMKEIMKK